MKHPRMRISNSLGTAISLALGLPIVGAGPAAAQGNAAAAAGREGVEDEIYVYGRSLEHTLPQELAAYGSDLVSIGRTAVEENAYVDAQQALQMQVPGLYITPVGPFSYSYISIQGSRTGRYDASDVLWVVDGVRINNRLYAGTLTDTLPGNMIERIEVLKGGESLFYGTSAVGGVVNIVTRDFSDEFNGDISLALDGNDSYGLAGMARGAVGEGNYVVYASQDESDGYELWAPSEPSATAKKRSYDVSNIGAKYGIDLTSALRLTAQYQHTEAELDDLRPTGTNYAANNRDEEIASFRLDYEASENAGFFLKTYYHDWDTHFTRINNVVGSPGTTTVISDNDFWGYEDYGLNALGKFRGSGGVEYLVGYDYQRYNARDEVWQIDPATETVNALFGQIRSSDDLFENGAVAFGARINDTGETSATIWNFTGRYDFSDSLYFLGSISTNFVLPSAEQLFLNEPGSGSGQGNPNLDPERGRNFNVSIGGELDRAYWQLTAFSRVIEDVILVDESDLVTYPDGIFMNMGEAEIDGFEFLGGVELSDSLLFEGSYTDAKAELTEPTPQNRQMNYNPRSHAKLSLRYDRGRYGGTFAARWVGDVHASQGAFGLVEYGNYTVADLSAFFYVDREESQQIVLRLENAFDEEYATGFRTGTPDAGGPAFLSAAVGVPRTLQLTYRRKF